MKKILLLSVFVCLAGSAFATTRFQSAYRWRNDDGDELSATWRAPQSTPDTITDMTAIRLRAEWKYSPAPEESEDTSTTILSGNLYYSDDSGTTWVQISNDMFNAFAYATSTNVDNGTATTSQITGANYSFTSGYFTSGYVISAPPTSATYVSLPTEHRTEFEWVIQPTTNVSNYTTYWFLRRDTWPAPSVDDIYAALTTNIGADGCNGMPANGTAIASIDSACTGTDFLLSLGDIEVATGMTYQWYGRPAGAADFTPLSSILTSPLFSASQAATTDYYCITTCTGSGLSAVSDTLTVYQKVSLCYCTPVYTYTTCSPVSSISQILQQINDFQLSGDESPGIDQQNTGCIGAFVDFTSLSAILTSGYTYSGSFNSGGSSFGTNIWIDYNANGVFEPSESIAATIGFSTTFSFTVPAAQPTGSYRMRVRRAHAGSLDPDPATIDPCAEYYTGETHDYTVHIVNNCSGVIPAAITLDPTSCNNMDGSITLTGLDADSSYAVSYTKDGVALPAINLTADGSGNLVIGNLAAGSYDNIMATLSSGCTSGLMGSVTLSDGISGSTIATASSTETGTQGSGFEVNYNNSSCELIATVSSADSLGSVTAMVTIAGGTQMYNGNEPYIGRYYDLTAGNNVGGTVTIYFTDAEINAYNTTVNGLGNAMYPAIGSNGENLRITAYHSPAPGSGPNGYDTAGSEVIIPVSIVHNGSVWEVTFMTSSFSGFFAHTNQNGNPLPVKLADISAVNQGAANRVDWSTAEEATGDRFVIERSAEGKHFEAVGSTEAQGISGSRYSFVDATPFTGVNYYRIEALNNDGSRFYSKVVRATVSNGDLRIDAFPNPVKDELTVKANGMINGIGTLVLTDVSGRVVGRAGIESHGMAKFPMEHLSQGMYILKFQDDSTTQTIKVNKK